MTTTLTSTFVRDTYGQVLHVDGGPEATEKTVHSGTGVATALKVGTDSVVVDNVRIDGNTISTTNSNGDLVLAPNGTGAVAISKVNITSGTIGNITALGIGSGGTGANNAAGACSNLGVGVEDSPHFTAVNIGHATDTTLTRVSAGVVAVEGSALLRAADFGIPGGVQGYDAATAKTSMAQTFSAQQTFTGGLVLQTIAAASIADITHDINTIAKAAGKVVFDTTNNRLMVASGAAAADPWYVADASASVTPV